MTVKQKTAQMKCMRSCYMDFTWFTSVLTQLRVYVRNQFYFKCIKTVIFVVSVCKFSVFASVFVFSVRNVICVLIK